MPKKSMTTIDLLAWLTETRDKLLGARIVNIYSANNIFLLKIWGKTGKETLLLEPGRRIHLTRYEHRVSEQKQPIPLVSGLRKYIRNGRIIDVKQVGTDRIVEITIGASGDTYKLIVELVPRGLLLLLNKNNKIVYSTEYREMRDRIIRRGVEYKPPPPPPDVMSLTVDEALELVRRGKDIVRGLVRGLGIPGELAEEVLSRLGLEKNTKSKEISRDTMEKILEEVRKIIEDIVSGRIEAYHVIVDGKLETVLPYKPLAYSNAELKKYDSFNEALDDYFVRIEKEEYSSTRKKELETALARVKASIEKQKETIKEYEEEAKKKRFIAEKISEKYPLLEQIVNCVNEVYDRYGWNKIIECKGVKGFDKHRGLVTIDLDGIKVVFRIKSKPYDVLNEYFKVAKEYERKVEKAKKVLSELEEKMTEIAEKMIREEAKSKARIKKKEWYERYHWIITRNGFLVIGGKNIDQNESIVRKYLEENDIFMHADIHGAPVVVIKTSGKEPSDEDILEAAVIAACYSKAWKSGAGYVDVYWVKGAQVSKSPPSGEYLPKGSFMVYGKRNYVRVQLILGVGIEIVENTPKVIVGKPERIAEKTRYYAILVPGDIDPSKIAKKLREYWVKKAGGEEKPFIEAVTVEDIRERIPGRSRIIKLNP